MVMTQFPLLGEEQSLKAFLRPSSSHTPSKNIEKKEARLAGSGLMWIWVISREGQGLDFFTLWARLTDLQGADCTDLKRKEGRAVSCSSFPYFLPLSFYLDLLGAMIRGGDGAWELHGFKAPWGEHKGVWRPEGDFLSHPDSNPLSPGPQQLTSCSWRIFLILSSQD